MSRLMRSVGPSMYGAAFSWPRCWHPSGTCVPQVLPIHTGSVLFAGGSLFVRRVEGRRFSSAGSTVLATSSDSYAPNTPPVSHKDLEKLVAFLLNHENVLAIAGAGCSTESGVPDYRGPNGAYTRNSYQPMTHQRVRRSCNMLMISQRCEFREKPAQHSSWHAVHGKRQQPESLLGEKLCWLDGLLAEAAKRIAHGLTSPSRPKLGFKHHHAEC